MFKQSYSQEELDKILKETSPRKGWDFSSMKVEKKIIPWKYLDIVKQYVKQSDKVLDIGTGGGEAFIKLAPYFKSGLGVDIDPEMVNTANKNAKKIKNIDFKVDSEKLKNTKEKFNLILNRHAPFNAEAISQHLLSDGFFITQQVAINNMSNIKKVIKHKVSKPVGSKEEILKTDLKIIEFREYDVEYIVKNVESLVFWLKALDMLHADIHTDKLITQSDVLNNILKGNLNEKGFVTNEHRYLLVAQKL